MENDEQFKDFIAKCLERHLAGDWGDVDPTDWKSNEQALEEGSRLFSVYKTERPCTESVYGVEHRIWIITEADRSATTVLFPSEH